MARYRFVGGAWDGKQVVLPRNSCTWCVPVLPLPLRFDSWLEPHESLSTDTHYYTREKYQHGDGRIERVYRYEHAVLLCDEPCCNLGSLNMAFYINVPHVKLTERVEAFDNADDVQRLGCGVAYRPTHLSPHRSEFVNVGVLRTSAFDAVRIAYDQKEHHLMDGEDVHWYCVPKEWALDNCELFRRWYYGRGMMQPERD